MNKLIKGSAILASLATLALAGQAARADYSSTATTTTTSSPTVFVNGATIGPGPQLLVTDTLGEQLMVPSILNANPVMFVTTGAQITGFMTYLPNDLLTRRDDLLARIFSERANGKLSADQASTLISQVQAVLNKPCVAGKECNVAHARQVKFMYRDFDYAANDIRKASGQDNKQLAGTYSFIVL
jgi:hypothetical protein